MPRVGYKTRGLRSLILGPFLLEKRFGETQSYPAASTPPRPGAPRAGHASTHSASFAKQLVVFIGQQLSCAVGQLPATWGSHQEPM